MICPCYYVHCPIVIVTLLSHRPASVFFVCPVVLVSLLSSCLVIPLSGHYVISFNQFVPLAAAYLSHRPASRYPHL